MLNVVPVDIDPLILLTLPDNMKIILEIKNYTNTVNRDEITKLEYDMKYNNINWAIMTSFNSNLGQQTQKKKI